MDDPKETRLIQTRDGIARVPRTQMGVPLREYLRNTDLPENLERAVIFATPGGPVAVEPDPAPWTEAHDAKVRDYAASIKEQIDEKGYYAKSLDHFAGRLARETGYPRPEMKALIVSTFDAAEGKDPFAYLQDRRAEQGLPVREQEPGMDREQEPEL